MVDLKCVFSKCRVLIDLSHIALVTGSVAAALRSVVMLGYMTLSVFCSTLGALLTSVLLGLPCHLRYHTCNSTQVA